MRQIVPLVLMVVCLSMMALLRQFWPPSVLLHPPFMWMGLIPLLAGVALMAAALYRFKRFRTTIVPFRKAQYLVTDGVCRYSRNPMYLGDILILIGVWVLMGAVSPIVVVMAFGLIADRCFVRAEEAMLLKKFGHE